jgi:DNA polymerase/3'-5' exonuclease PolX
MENTEIARVLNQYADLLEIQDEGLFRVLAYRNAARTIESLSQPVAQLSRRSQGPQETQTAGDRQEYGEHVEEIIKTGTLQALKHLAREIGVKIAINTDAHNTEQLHFMRYGIDQSRRGWLEKRDVLNSMPLPNLERWLRQPRQRFAKAAGV